MDSDNPRLKDIFFSQAFLRDLARDLRALDPAFDTAAFLAAAGGETYESLALKQKMRHVTECLHNALAQDYATVLSYFTKIAPNYRSFDGMVFSDYVACYGLQDWDRSLPALREFTRTISAEFAIRPFLRHDPKRVLPYLLAWAADPDPAVRRLASEGSRPRLPWGMDLPAFKRDPTPLLPILEMLKDDPSEDVRRSVANSLNDIAKDNPDLAMDIAESWYGQSEQVDRLVKHGCRSLLKAGDIRAMRLFGFTAPDDITVKALAAEPQQVPIGGDAYLSYTMAVAGDTVRWLRLEYAIHYLRASGRKSRKVFHHREGQFQPGEHVIKKKLSFRDLSTRSHVPGLHTIEIIINGVTLAWGRIDLLP